jgi:hypothetical protein
MDVQLSANICYFGSCKDFPKADFWAVVWVSELEQLQSIITVSQSGFRSLHGTLTALIERPRTSGQSI